MCNAGRIVHHLKHNIWKKETHVLFVGYQAQNSLGRRIVDGEPRVKIHGERIPLRAQVHTLGGFSAHAGQKDLLEWMSAIAPSKPRVIVTHGEDRPRNILAEQVRKRFGLKTLLPAMGEIVEL